MHFGYVVLQEGGEDMWMTVGVQIDDDRIWVGSNSINLTDTLPTVTKQSFHILTESLESSHQQ